MSRKSRRGCPLLLGSVVALLVLYAGTAGAQKPNSSPNLVGSGARALGMGGAFIAVADDATAASWNPGGLTQLERPEVSAVYNWKWLSEDWASGIHPELEADHDIDLDELNYASIVYPIRRTLAGRNFVISLNYQRKYDFDRSLDIDARLVSSLSAPFTAVTTNLLEIDYLQEGALGTLSPAFGFEITNRLSCGMVVNIWDSSIVPGNEWKEVVRRRSRVQTVGRLFGRPFSQVGLGRLDTYTEYEDFEGTNYTFGLHFRALEGLSLGAVYHTKFAADLKRTETNRIFLYPNSLAVTHRREKIRMEWPSAVGLGAAYRFPNDKLTLTLDVTRREWDQFVLINKNERHLRDVRKSPVTNLPIKDSHHKPTYSVRLGGEYVFVDPTRPKQKYLPSLRAGLYYDPEPASGRADRWWGVTCGSGNPDDYYGATLGLGLLVGSRVNIDAAYEYRWGNNVRRDTWAGTPLERGFSVDVDQHQFYLSTVIYF